MEKDRSRLPTAGKFYGGSPPVVARWQARLRDRVAPDADTIFIRSMRLHAAAQSTVPPAATEAAEPESSIIALRRIARLAAAALRARVAIGARVKGGDYVLLCESDSDGVLLTEFCGDAVQWRAAIAGGGALMRLVDSRGGDIGMLCASAEPPRQWTRVELELLRAAAESASEALRRGPERLGESEARYRLLFDRNPLPMWIYDTESLRILAVNDAATHHYGWTRDEFLGMTPRDLRPVEDLEEFERLLEVARRAHASAPRMLSRVRHRRRDGSLISVDVWSSAITFAGHRARLVLAHDVSDRVAAERSLRESEARFRAFVERSSDALVVIDARGKVAYASPAVGDILGASPEEFVGTDFLEPVHPADRRLTAERFAQAMRDIASTDRIEVRVRHADGSYRHLEALGSVLEADEISEARLLLSVRDTTERRQAESALRASEERFRSLAASSPLGVFLADEAGRVTYSNPSAQEMWGVPEEGLVESRWEERVHPEDRALVMAAWLQSVREERTFENEYRLHGADGRVRWIHEVARPMRDSAGTVTGFVRSVEDVTDRRELESHLRQSQKMEAVGQLAGGVAHDFNNLLTVIKAHTEFLLEVIGPDDPAREDVVEIGKAGSRAAALTRQLLAFSRKQLLRPRALDLASVVADLEPMLRRLIGEDVAVEVVAAPEPAVVRADPGQLEQVLMNLAVNARDAMRSGGTLTIATERLHLDAPLAHDHGVVQAGEWVVLRVTDTGEGMPPAVRLRAFEPFFTTKGPGQGTGLGLATVYGIVRQSGGHVMVASEPARGTTLAVYLPPATLTPAVEPATRQPSSAAGGTILLVEDEAPVRTLARRILEQQGYRVLEARHGRDAIDVATRHEGRIDLLLTDVMMPQMSGRELAEAIGELRPEMRVVYMSGYTDDVIMHRGALSPRLVLVHKPFTAKELTEAVAGAIG